MIFYIPWSAWPFRTVPAAAAVAGPVTRPRGHSPCYDRCFFLGL